MPRPKGLAKTGGRRVGSLNKKTVEFTDKLESTGFDLVEAAISLYAESDNSLKFKILELLASYRYFKPKDSPDGDVIEVTPEDQELEGQSTDTLLLALSKPNP